MRRGSRRAELVDMAWRHPEEIEAAVDAGADPDARDPTGRTALHLAAGEDGTDAAVRALIACGADVDVVDASGASPLHEAALWGRAAAAALLVGHGAAIGRRDARGSTPLAVACSCAWNHQRGSIEGLVGALASRETVGIATDAGRRPAWILVGAAERIRATRVRIKTRELASAYACLLNAGVVPEPAPDPGLAASLDRLARVHRDDQRLAVAAAIAGGRSLPPMAPETMAWTRSWGPALAATHPTAPWAMGLFAAAAVTVP